ncbi:ABC transporter ATP-binding protein [Noviherbaspirillum sedimenti]|uniref:ABC transporter ATP-binding protein n=1 Tax=Noviherbaspirillum sedimenti TaxID=2320865 RepID=A0A3A3G1U7_9BURK|nr:ABC transporter ATP-binding protein [Noviherbaspirillum sedimenti]RJG01625.1 ABC transporter ATP-binding protein [Noviherbaspirillum sedimenti]
MPQQLVDVAVREKSFAAKTVMLDVDFQVHRGEIVSLVGPSGCGKSTLLRIISGLDRDFRGKVVVNGHAPVLHSRDVGLVFQEPRLLPWLTVAENVGFDLGRKGGAHPKVKELLSEVGLADFANAYPKQLSGGMAQRVAIARGLFTQPALLLLDEPFSAVDAFTRMRLQDLLLSVAANHGTTLLLITHDITEAIYLSDRVIALTSHPGRLSGEVRVDIPRQRDRRSPELALLEREALALLTDGRPDYFATDAREFGPVLRQAVVHEFKNLQFAV